MRFSGLFAWLMWRGIYVSKAPRSWTAGARLADWVIELFFRAVSRRRDEVRSEKYEVQ
ncbi:MAG: hypothetical protein U0841_18895 [Chloroflexia bacterium]